jgi:phosphoribosylformylglycinamidine (FGAM) synthase-like amidotransferase family enzyme
MMNPSGKVLDIHGIQALGEEVNIQTIPQHPERLFDIVRDLNTQKGRGTYEKELIHYLLVIQI